MTNRQEKRTDASLAKTVREKAQMLADAIDDAIKCGLNVQFNIGPDPAPEKHGKVVVLKCDISRQTIL